jgi:hypothetical protein
VRLRDSMGKVAKWIGMNIDITERKRAEGLLRGSQRT